MPFLIQQTCLEAIKSDGLLTPATTLTPDCHRSHLHTQPPAITHTHTPCTHTLCGNCSCCCHRYLHAFDTFNNRKTVNTATANRSNVNQNPAKPRQPSGFCFCFCFCLGCARTPCFACTSIKWKENNTQRRRRQRRLGTS